MATKKHKLTLIVGPYQKSVLENYKARTGLNYTEAFKCWIMSLQDEGNVDGRAELTAILERAQERISNL